MRSLYLAGPLLLHPRALPKPCQPERGFAVGLEPCLPTERGGGRENGPKKDPKREAKGGPKWATNKHVSSRGGRQKGPKSANRKSLVWRVHTRGIFPAKNGTSPPDWRDISRISCGASLVSVAAPLSYQLRVLSRTRFGASPCGSLYRTDGGDVPHKRRRRTAQTAETYRKEGGDVPKRGAENIRRSGDPEIKRSGDPENRRRLGQGLA